MPDKIYRIVWTVNDTNAVSAAKRNTKLATENEAAWLRALKAAESVGAASAKMATTHQNAMTAAVQKGAATRKSVTKEEQTHVDIGLHKMQVTGIKFQDTLSASAKKNADYRSSVFDKAARDEHNRAVKYAKQTESAALGPYGRQARFRENIISRAAANEMAINKMNRLHSNERIKMIMQEQGVMKDNFAQSISAAFGLQGAATAAGAAVLGIGAGAIAVGAVATAFGEAKRNSEAMAKSTLEFMVALRPLASVMGVNPDGGLVKQVGGFGAETGMGSAQASQFMENFFGRANPADVKNLSKKEFERFQVMAGKMTTARGLPADTGGNLFAGVLNSEDFKSKGQGAEHAIARANEAFKILDAGVGIMKELIPQQQKALARLVTDKETTGFFKNAAEAAVAVSLQAEGNQGEEEMGVRATMRALGKFGDKKRGAFLKAAGITPGMPGLERMKRANEYFNTQTAAGTPLETIFSEAGINETREQSALRINFNAQSKFASQTERMKALEAPGQVDAVQKALDERFQNKDVRFTIANARLEVARLKEGSTEAVIAKTEAEAKLVTGDFDDGFWAKIKQAAVGVLTLSYATGITGREALIEKEALEERRRQAGQSTAPEGGFGMAGTAATGLLVSPLAMGSAITTEFGKLLEAIWGRNSPTFEKLKTIADNTGGAKTPPALPVGPPAGVAIH